MKNNTFLLIFIILFTIKTDQSFSQALKDSIHLTSTVNYYQIPKDDFEKILNNRIESEVSGKLEFWTKVFGIIFALSGFFGVWQIRRIIKNIIDEALDINNQKFIDDIKDLKNKLHEQRIEVKEDIREIYTTIDKRYEEFRNITNEANKAATRIEVERIKSNLSLKSEEKIIKFEEKLKVIIGYNDNDFASEVIDLLGVEYYKLKSEKLIELIEQYSQSPIKLWYKTYMNGGLDQYYNYEEHYLDTYKQNCLKYCNKALELSPVYGEPYFIKLSIYAMDYQKSDLSNNLEKKQELFEKIKEILVIIMDSSELMCNDLIRSINYRKNIPIFITRIDTFTNLFPEELKLINEKSAEYEKKTKPQL